MTRMKKKAIKMYSAGNACDALMQGIPSPGRMAFGVEFEVIQEVLYTNDDGEITIKKENIPYKLDVIGADEMIEFLIAHYDWNFMYKRDFPGYNHEYSDLQALSYIWERFTEHNRDNFTRAIRDMYYDYNPIYNYDRNEVHYYNINDNGSDTESGQYNHTIVDSGDEIRRHSGSNATSNTTQYGGDGDYIETGLNWSNPEQPSTSAKASSGTGVEMKTQNYSNSFENTDGGTASNKMTDSQVQTGTMSDNGVSQDAYVDTTTFNGRTRKDTIDYGKDGHVTTHGNAHTGQDGIKTVGNIGVVTSTAMVKEDILFRIKTNIASMILDKFAKETLFLGVDSDEDYDWYN